MPSKASYSDISTHTLRKEGDMEDKTWLITNGIFQPTPSARRVTNILCFRQWDFIISTHTLRKEGDSRRR